jgi:hypothetical protein
MTIDEFHKMITRMVMERTASPRAYADYIRHKTRPDKYLHEEYLAIQAVVVHKGYPGTTTIELGDEKQPWDARVGGTDLFEVVQALPQDEHEIRRQLPSSVRPFTYLMHAKDHLQFPQVIIDAIELKHGKVYTDSRTLIVAFDGDYSFEEDENIHRWVTAIREKTYRGVFKEILLVEVARRKAFPVF